MPYKIKQSGSGYKVTSPNHKSGFSKKPQTKSMARKQQQALYANAPDTSALKGLTK